VARPKKAKQHREPESIAHTLDEIESRGDRISIWISENPIPILGTGLGILLLVGGLSLVVSMQESRLEDASAALGVVQAEYRQAMGASLDDVIVNEPANPETARRVREEYTVRFAEVAAEHAGTAGAALAGLEAGLLEQALGMPDEAVSTWQATVSELEPGDTIAALLELRLAAAFEADARWVEAGEAFERAADIESFPLGQTARAEAARCYAEAGEIIRALAAYDRVKNEDPAGFLPEHLDAQLLELRATQLIN
jgi:tetratricopeptide (TPR) repeat protein